MGVATSLIALLRDPSVKSALLDSSTYGSRNVANPKPTSPGIRNAPTQLGDLESPLTRKRKSALSRSKRSLERDNDPQRLRSRALSPNSASSRLKGSPLPAVFSQ